MPRRPEPRTLTEAIRALDSAGLTRLLADRPDLHYPTPHDLAELASLASTGTSLARAVDRLDAFQRLVCEALAALPDSTTVPDVAALAGAPERAVRAAVSVLRHRLLLWGLDDQLHLLRGVRDAFEPFPGGLAAPSPWPLSDAEIDAALAEAGPTERAVLDRLTWGPPTGAVRNADRAVDPGSPQTPVRRLIARRLLRPLDPDTVVLAREVALRLRRPATLRREPVPVDPPGLQGPLRSSPMVDQAAVGAAFAVLHDLDSLVHALEQSPYRVLRDGGVASRDVGALARRLGADASAVGFLLECAGAAGLVAPGGQARLLPTAQYDRWAVDPDPERWHRLVLAWAGAARWFAQAAEPGEHPLAPRTDRPDAPRVRRVLLDVSASAAPATVVREDDLVTAAGWRLPRLAGSAALRTWAAWTLAEAEQLGLTALGATTSTLAAAIADDPLPAPLVSMFPEPAETIVIQADLTAVATGPLPRPVVTELRLLADQESRGGGGVWRFSAGSVRRSFEAGWSESGVLRWLERHSTTGVPQPLGYLVADVARRYGRVRVGQAHSYLRVDDEPTAAAVLAHPDAPRLGLREVGGGVLIADADADEVAELLRAMGLAPAIEDATGLVTAPPHPRAAGAAPLTAGAAPRALPDPRQVAQAILAHSRSTVDSNVDSDVDSTDDTLRALSDAAASTEPVRLAYVSADGTTTVRSVTAVRFDDGLVQATDVSDESLLSVPVARISSVSPQAVSH